MNYTAKGTETNISNRSALSARARQLCVALATVALLALSSAFAPVAQAGKTADHTFGAPGSGAGQLDRPGDIAVNDPMIADATTDPYGASTDGYLYVVDQRNHRVAVFGADQSFKFAFGSGVNQTSGGDVCPRPSFPADVCGPGSTDDDGRGGLDDPQGLDVNQSNGDVYVRDRDNHRVQVFAADGSFKFMFGRAVNQTSGGDVCPRPAFPADLCQAGVSGTEGGAFLSTFSDGLDLAVAPPASPAAGDVFIADHADLDPARRLERFTATGEFVEAFGSSGHDDPNAFLSSSPSPDLAVDDAGIVYATNGPNGILRYETAAQAFLEKIPAAPFAGQSATQNVFLGAEVNPLSGDLLALSDSHQPGEHSELLELDTAPTPAEVTIDDLVDLHMARGGDFRSSGIAVDGQAGVFYVSDPVGDRIVVLDDDGPTPFPAVSPTIEDIGAHHAELGGTLDPNGSQFDTSYWFEYSRDGGEWTRVQAPINAGNGDGEVALAPQTISGLEANSSYRVRLLALRELGAGSAESEILFATPEVPPEAATGPVRQRSDTSAYLTATINPNNLPTAYRFEWGETSGYGNVVPIPDGQLEGGQPQLVGARLSGLEPGTTYHYRIFAESSKGQAVPQGEDRTFSTREAVEPPAARTYEMVTPPEKVNRRIGAPASRPDLINNPGLASPDGEAIMLGFFAGILDPEQGTGFPYAHERVVIRRDALQGRWVSRAVNNLPAAETSATGTPLLDTNGLSADFDVQIWWHTKPLFPSRSVMSTKVMSDVGRAGYRNSGWHEWIPDQKLASFVGFSNGEHGLVDDDGDRLLRFFPAYRGLLGPADPSLGQLAPTPPGCGAGTSTLCTFPGGSALYVQEPPGSGPRHLVSECTDSDGATQIPVRLPSGEVGLQACGEGSPTSVRGAIAGGPHHLRAMSGDGKRIFFTSPDPEVAPEACSAATGTETACPPQIFVRQYDGSAPGTHGEATVRWISRSRVSAAQQASLLREAYFEGASKDGRYVYFRTDAPLTDDDPNGGESITAGPASPDSWDLYRYELPAGEDGIHGSADDIEADPAGGELVRITGGLGGAADPNTNNEGGGAIRYLSEDGRRAYFVTRGKLGDAFADNSSPLGSSAANAASGMPTAADTRNLYLYDEGKSGVGRWKFVARLAFAEASEDPDSCATALSAPAGVLVGHALHRKEVVEWQAGNCVRGTHDGKVVAFQTSSQLTEDDVDTAVDIYLYDAGTDELVRVSAPPVGAEPYACNVRVTGEILHRCNADLGSNGIEESDLGLEGLAHYNLAVDPEGEVSLFFESRLALVPEDTNGDHWDVYQWRNGGLDLISTGDTANHSWYSGNSTDGEDVFIQTTQRIDPREIERADLDVYDARVGGGFPLAPSSAPCDVLAGQCSPPPSPSPLAASPRSSRFRGTGSGAEGCGRLAKGAARLIRQSERLRRAARGAGSPRLAQALHRKATGKAKLAKRASERARRCRARARGRAR